MTVHTYPNYEATYEAALTHAEIHLTRAKFERGGKVTIECIECDDVFKTDPEKT